jgi:peptidyl-prolyl cis-trans isomerase D
MLQAIRDRVMGVVGWIVLGLLTITFAFFGLDSYLQSSAENYAAKVNDAEISPAQHDRTYQQMLTRMRQALGEGFDPGLVDESLIKRNSLTKLINEELISQAADSAGLAVSEKQLASQIVSVEEFKQDGEFSKDRYTQVLRYQGMAPEQFEWQLSKEIVANQLKAGIILTASGPEDALRRAYALQGQLRRFNFMVIPESAVDSELTVGDQEIQDYYQNHAEQFKTEERVKVQYLELKASELKVAQSVDEEQIKALYAEHRDKYVTPEQRHARHILIVPGSDSEADLATAEGEAAEISSRLDKGADFAALAGELSDDPASAPAGGDLGTFGKGAMVPEVEEAVFNLKVGERTKPVKSTFGFHIIELLGIVPEKATPIEEVRQELVDELLGSERNAQYVEKIDTLANLAFEQPDSLQGAAAELGLEIQQSDWISRSGGSGIVNNPKVIEAVFADDVLKSGNNSQPVEIGEDHVVVLRVVDHQQAALPPLDDIRDQVTAAARKDAATRLLKARGDALLADLVGGKATMDSTAQALNLKIEFNTLLPRNSRNPSPLIVSRAFVLPRAELNKPVYDGFLQPEGGYILLSLEEVQDGKYDDLPEAERKQAWRSLNELLGTNEMQMVISELEARANIRIPEPAAQ